MKKPKNNSQKLTCPFCKKERDVNSTMLPAYFRETIGSSYNFDQWLKYIRTTHNLLWACNLCIRAGRASMPSYKKQNAGMTGSRMVYAPLQLECNMCLKPFTFGAGEQRYWYEVLHFNTNSHPKQCAPCRKEIRRARNNNTRLGELLKIKKPTRDELEAIESIYLEMGKVEKAGLFRKKIDRLTAPKK